MRDEQGRNQLLIAELSALHDREAQTQQAYMTVAAVTVPVVTLIAFNLPGPCSMGASEPSTGSASCLNDWIFLVVPAAVTILLAIAAALAATLAVLGTYASQVEYELQQLIGASLRLGLPEPHRQKAPYPNYFRSAGQLYVARGPGRHNFVWWTAISALIAFLLVGEAVYALWNVHGVVQFVAIVVFVPLNVLSYRTLAPGKSGRVRLAQYITNREEADKGFRQRLRVVEAVSASSRRFLRYLVIPRVIDHLGKVLFLPAGFLLGWFATSRVEWQGIGTLIFTIGVFEYGFYQARYMVNDLRGLDEDLDHPMERARSRIPAPHTRSRIALVLMLAVLRFAVSAAVAAALSPSAAVRGSLLAGAAAILALGVWYEYLRARSRDAVIRMSPREWKPGSTKRTILSLYAVVALGYPVRVLVGAWAGSNGRIGLLNAAILALGVYLIELAAISMFWVLESTAYLSPVLPSIVYDETLEKRPHIKWLAEYSNLLVPGARPAERLDASAKR